MTRSQDGQTLSCADPRFDLGLWMSYADFRELVRVYVLGCKEWDDSGPMIAREDWKKLFDSLLVTHE